MWKKVIVRNEKAKIAVNAFTKMNITSMSLPANITFSNPKAMRAH